MLRPLIVSSFLLCAFCASASAQQTSSYSPEAQRAIRHATIEWETVASHLPDPATGSPAALQTAGDVLRARRLPEDAIDYYRFALQRGGDEPNLLNRIGVTELEMGQVDLAHACFKRVVMLKKKSPEAWNNLGAVANMTGDTREAISDYQRAVKLNKKNALFHANLGTAYLATRDYESARGEFETAVKLDPEVFSRGGFGGTQVHVLSADDRGRFPFEMARMAAEHHQDEVMLHWLAQASEAGFDVVAGMNGVPAFAPYLKDPRVGLLIANAKAMRGRQVAASGPAPPLPPVDAKEH